MMNLHFEITARRNAARGGTEMNRTTTVSGTNERGPDRLFRDESATGSTLPPVD
jgi:hypothetical protein